MQLQSKVLHYSLYLFKIIPCIAPPVNLYGFCESPDASCHHMPLSKSTPGPAGVTQHRTPFIRTAWTRHKLWRKGKEMLPVSQRLAPEHWLGARAIASQRPIGQNRREPASPASICSRLRCLSFQSTTSSATGKQPPSRPPASLERPPRTQNANSASNDTAAAGKQDADRIQASEDATTSGREYWQVSNLYCACEEKVPLG